MKKITFVVILIILGQLWSFAGFYDEDQKISKQTGVNKNDLFTKANFGESVAIGRAFYHKVKLITSQEGEVKVPWASLPIDFQMKHAKDKESMEAKARDEAIGAKTFVVTIIQVLSNGVLVDKMKAEYIDAPVSHMASIGGGGGVGPGGGFSYRMSGNIVFIQGVKGFAENKQLDVKAYPDGVYNYTDTSNASRTVEKWILISLKN